MTDRAEFDGLVSRFNVATNAIAARLAALERKVTDAGLPAGVEAEVLSEFRALAEGLEALGRDPGDPVPETPAASPA